MSKTVDLPFYTIQTVALADWLERLPEQWWTVDGDPRLTSLVDFPCPSKELADELRRVNQKMCIFDPRDGSIGHGQPIAIDELEQIADRQNNFGARNFLLSWEGDDNQWLLSEYAQGTESD